MGRFIDSTAYLPETIIKKMAAGFKQRKNRSILHDQLSYHINYGISAGPAESNLLEEVLEGLRRYRRGEYEK
jgi:hypothetical protein